MTSFQARRRLALAGILAAAAIGSAAPAHADDVSVTAADCEARLQPPEAQFHEMAERRGYEAASEWWHAHLQSCVLHIARRSPMRASRGHSNEGASHGAP